MSRVGRPTTYNNEIGTEICHRIAKGESLRSICDDDGTPGLTTVRRWLSHEDHNEFRLQYAQAREEQADYYADEIIEIADSADDTNKARLQIDARRWKASRMSPRKWGDKITNEVTGPDGGPIILWGSKSE